jgi:DNA polymerase I
MIGYNISPDTLLTGKEKTTSGEYNEAPEVGHRFRKQPDGFFKRILQELITKRFEMKKKLKMMKAGRKGNFLTSARRQSKFSPTASTATWAGSGALVSKGMRRSHNGMGPPPDKGSDVPAKAQGIEVYYGDTDSVFCSYSGRFRNS